MELEKDASEIYEKLCKDLQSLIKKHCKFFFIYTLTGSQLNLEDFEDRKWFVNQFENHFCFMMGEMIESIVVGILTDKWQEFLNDDLIWSELKN